MSNTMIHGLLRWLGFDENADRHHKHEHGGHGHVHEEGHGHTHGVVDPSIATTEEGISAVKKSFLILAATAILQLLVVYVSGSVALLADTIHNIGDATTALPLWLAFALARRPPTKSFNYGLGRVEDLAGIVIVLIIFASAMVALYESIDRLLEPRPVASLGWLAAAGLIGFAGNELVALLRISVGRRINSAALVADGYHARTDGLTSLAVILGAAGVWLGYPLADPIVGLLITVAILGIVWQSARAVLRRMLDGIDPHLLDEIRHAASHVEGVDNVAEARARWIGHKLHIDLTVSVPGDMPMERAARLADGLRHELSHHLPALGRAVIQFRPS